MPVERVLVVKTKVKMKKKLMLRGRENRKRVEGIY
jgi:hypothetical protein